MFPRVCARSGSAFTPVNGTNAPETNGCAYLVLKR